MSRKITRSAVKVLAAAASEASDGRIALRTVQFDGVGAVYVGNTREWRGRDASRQAAAYYAGALVGLYAVWRAPWCTGLIAELGEHYACHVEAGRSVAGTLLANRA